MVLNFFLENWALILILMAFTVVLKTTVFLDARTIKRMSVLIVLVFLLSIVVYIEFVLTDNVNFRNLRLVLIAIRYSATPFIVAQVIHTMVKKFRMFVFIPAIVHALINFISIFNGVVFSIDSDNVFHRGPLGLLPFIVAGLYSGFLVYALIKKSNKTFIEVVPIAFLCFALLTGLLLPFIFGKAYSHLFCTIIAIALFVYYVFLILQMTTIDPLTGLLNRQAFYADIRNRPEEITALLSLDINGLKTINDTDGHSAGDEALTTLAECFNRAMKRGQSTYRIGGDEFVTVCRKSSRSDVMHLVERIRNAVSASKYSCSVGYCCRSNEAETIDEILKESDKMMYADKARHYADIELDRRG